MKRPRAQLLALACVAVIALLGLAFVACLPGYTFGTSEPADGGADTTSSSDSGSGSDGAGGVDGPFEAATEGGAGPDGGGIDGSFDAAGPDAMTTVAVTNTGSKQYAAGYGYQIHLVYAQNAARYWLFFADDTAGVIETAWSTDLVTWTGAEPITLTSGFSIGDGSSFSVAYANVGGADVVHIVENSVNVSDYQSFHVRATVSGATITASVPVGLPDTDSNGGQGSSGSACPQDGPAVTIGANGRVWDVTAWTGHAGNTTCDTNIYESTGIETGAGWDGGTLVHDGYYVSLPDIDFAHDLVDLPDAGLVMALYSDYDVNDETDPQNFNSIGWALSTSFSGGGPGTTGVGEQATSELFNGSAFQASFNDWTACRLTDDDVHVMRHVITADGGATLGAFEEVMYNGSTWQTLTPPPSVDSTTNSGLVLLSDANPADGMLAAVIGTDNAIHIAKWTGAGGWNATATIPPGGSTRQGLSGTGCGTSRPAIFWTDGAGDPNRIVLADLTGLLGP